jgi:hypothetical protein
MNNTQTNIPEFNDEDKRESNFHDFDNQPEVIGVLERIEQGNYGNNIVLRTFNNKEILIGSYEVLKSKITETDKGKWIKIVYKGNTTNPKTKRTYKDFEVYVK